jgi:lipoprotein-releasing system ATP-binding protein
VTPADQPVQQQAEVNMGESQTHNAALVAEGLRKAYPTPAGELVVLEDANLKLAAGEAAVITGPSGSGKSTLLNILGTLESPTAGCVSVSGTDPFALGERELARFRNKQIGFIFQDHHLLPHCSTIENVLLPTLAGADGEDKSQRAAALLEHVGLRGRADHRPAELSGGERQRVAIVRALINSPALLLADEPTGNLDGKSADTVGSLLLELQRDEGVTLLVVTHSPVLAERFQRRFTIVDGRLTEN